jgi:hypothetical protein
MRPSARSGPIYKHPDNLRYTESSYAAAFVFPGCSAMSGSRHPPVHTALLPKMHENSAPRKIQRTIKQLSTIVSVWFSFLQADNFITKGTINIFINIEEHRSTTFLKKP